MLPSVSETFVKDTKKKVKLILKKKTFSHKFQENFFLVILVENFTILISKSKIQ